MKNQKGFVVPILLMIIGLLLIGASIYVYKSKKIEVPAIVTTEVPQNNIPTPLVDPQTDTSNWKTYTDTKYGFELKYPVQILPEVNSQSGSAVLRLAVSFGGVYLTIGKTVYSLENLQKISFSSSNYQVEKTFLGDEKAIKVTRKDSSIPSYSVYAIRKGFVYSVSVPLENVDAEKILSTFKFTK